MSSDLIYHPAPEGRKPAYVLIREGDIFQGAREVGTLVDGTFSIVGKNYTGANSLRPKSNEGFRTLTLHLESLVNQGYFVSHDVPANVNGSPTLRLLRGEKKPKDTPLYRTLTFEEQVALRELQNLPTLKCAA